MQQFAMNVGHTLQHNAQNMKDILNPISSEQKQGALSKRSSNYKEGDQLAHRITPIHPNDDQELEIVRNLFDSTIIAGFTF